MANRSWTKTDRVLFPLKAWTKYANLEQLAIVFRLLQHCAKPTLFQWLGHCQKKHDDVCENSQTKLAWQVKNYWQDIRLCTTTKCFIWSLDVSCFLDFSWWHLGWCKNWCFTGKIVISAWKKKVKNGTCCDLRCFSKARPEGQCSRCWGLPLSQASWMEPMYTQEIMMRMRSGIFLNSSSLQCTFRINIKIIVMFTIHFDYPYPYQCCCHHHGEYSPISPGFVMPQLMSSLQRSMRWSSQDFATLETFSALNHVPGRPVLTIIKARP